ncbi:hypothetical protein GWK47_001540 [Chionoecetes opilio]|uniref:Uncharacterized protein n=1 Tax=Chionoecetes opilio TaxID=41210 RepID=A0A8J4XWC4_CHIOP|nr:hypothetical protein GWK47_001540 [Chionoecetes opilio]
MLQSTEKKQAKTKARKPAEKRRMTRKAGLGVQAGALNHLPAITSHKWHQTTLHLHPPQCTLPHRLHTPLHTSTGGCFPLLLFPPVSLPPPADAEHLVTLPVWYSGSCFSKPAMQDCEGDISVTVKSHGLGTSGATVSLQSLKHRRTPCPGREMEVF